MNIKKFISAIISYVLLTMSIAYPWHMILFHDFYFASGAYTRAEPSVPMGMLSMLVQGAVIAYLYPFYYRGGRPVVEGVKFSLLIGMVVYSVMGFAMVAKIDINPVSTYLMYSAVFQLIQFILTGAALGLIYGRIKPVGVSAWGQS